MCTVTIIRPEGCRFRLVTNRDELRTRPLALPPREHRLASGRRALWPIDAASGGTWVATQEEGLVLTVLNLNLRVRPQLPPRHHLVSRGLIVPQVIDTNDAQSAIDELESIPLDRFAPFRLIAADETQTIEARWDRSSLRFTHFGTEPLCFVSSGLGDHLVEPRLPLFEDMVVSRGANSDAQDEFHQHRWTDHPQISVRMDRTDARTVSHTAITVGDAGTIDMAYRADDASASLRLNANRQTTAVSREHNRQPC